LLEHACSTDLITGTSQKLSSSSKLLQTPPLEFPQLNGNESSKESQLTSTKSSRHSTMFSLMKREQVAWETQKLFLESPKARNGSQLHLNDLWPGGEHQKPSVLLSPIERRNSLNMETISKVKSPPNLFHRTINSSSTTSHFRMKLQEANMFNSRIIKNSQDSTPPLFFQMVWKHTLCNSTTKNQPHS
jgi:hypothetical protein